MKKSVEKEVKILLNEVQYNDLFSKLNWDKTYIQINNYFDTDTLDLHASMISCRVREKESGMKLQLKFKNNSNDSLYNQAEENEYKIDKIPTSFNEKECSDMGLNFNKPINLLGSLKTTRSKKSLSDTVVLFLDKSEYFDVTDYEIEVEFVHEYELEDIMKMLSNHGITADKNQKVVGKYTRFIQKLKS